LRESFNFVVRVEHTKQQIMIVVLLFSFLIYSGVRSQSALPPYSCPAGSAMVKPSEVSVDVDQTNGFAIDGSSVQLFDELTCSDVGSPQCFGCNSGIAIQCATAVFE
jgi:hypothetical protein